MTDSVAQFYLDVALTKAAYSGMVTHGSDGGNTWI